jgi:hypothetical protein
MGRSKEEAKRRKEVWFDFNKDENTVSVYWKEQKKFQNISEIEKDLTYPTKPVTILCHPQILVMNFERLLSFFFQN